MQNLRTNLKDAIVDVLYNSGIDEVTIDGMHVIEKNISRLLRDLNINLL